VPLLYAAGVPRKLKQQHDEQEVPILPGVFTGHAESSHGDAACVLLVSKRRVDEAVKQIQGTCTGIVLTIPGLIHVIVKYLIGDACC
jgi:hypothetical protein